jgi:alpha-D-ribose 1-methylphosphonate 5-triphosphate synthase subunit PhnH
VEAGTATFTFTNTATGCKNSTPILTVTSSLPCNQSITLVSPTNNLSSGSVVRQTNLGIDASNRVTGTSTNVTYQSGSSVTLKPGFQADAGTVFKAQIGGCN